MENRLPDYFFSVDVFSWTIYKYSHENGGCDGFAQKFMIGSWHDDVIKWKHFPRYTWRRQMETFSVLLALCAGNSPTQRPVTRSFDVYFDLRPNKRLSKQSWGWWFETSSRPLWRHRNGETAETDRDQLRLMHTWLITSVVSCGM